MEPYKILIAEDDRNIRAGVADALELEGYIPVEAPDGGAALRLYHEHHPDLLLLDIMMPGLSGYDVCRRDNYRLRIPFPYLHSAYGSVLRESHHCCRKQTCAAGR